MKSQNVELLNPLASPADEPVLLVSEDSLLLQNFFFYDTGAIDIRPFSSIGMVLRLRNGTMTTTDLTGVNYFFSMSTSFSISDVVGGDSFELKKTDLGSFNSFNLIDACAGSHFQLNILDSFSVNRSVELTLRLWGSKRPESGIRFPGLPDISWSSSVAGGATLTRQIPFFRGRGRMVSRISTGTGAVRIQTLGTGTPVAMDYMNMPTAEPNIHTREIVMPSHHSEIQLINNGGGPAIIRGYIIPYRGEI